MAFFAIYELLKAQAECSSESIAILAPDRAPLTYGRLQRQVENVVNSLNELGIGRNDRVAVVIPNGPEMVVAFLAIASGATSAPLNPAYRASEFEFYLCDLKAKGLVILPGMDSPAVNVARAHGIEVIELIPETDGPAGLFTLSGNRRPLAVPTGFAQPDDFALVLHTSGTTSGPKIVPLTQMNICSSGGNIRSSLELTSKDRCLNVMPLFHIHGLIGAVLSSLIAGASIVCTPGFDESKFFDWMEAFQPTWYTAVPTIHQQILAKATANHKIISQCPLRFIRSCSSSMPPKVMMELERVFNVPGIEAYGMTEASHQITSNPLPPRQRKAGSVGVAGGPEVAIMDEEGHFLSTGRKGEIAIRGVNVTKGYENNPIANQSSFIDGWFRTGDQGMMDDDGYLFITGRLKEIINRGGEKIAPREVDEALLDHPAVAQAVTFAVPHARLGEDVASAVVLRKDASATEKEIRQFAFARLANFKVPSQVLILKEIPKGPTAKIQRIGLAEKLAEQLRPAFVSPRNSVEEILAKIWAEALGLEQVGVRDNFFAIGGDSLLAARVVARMQRVFHVKMALPIIFQAPTIEDLASIVDLREWSPTHSSLVLLQDGGSKPPFFCLPGTLSNVFIEFSALARHLGPAQAVYGFQDRIGNPSGVETLAAHYLEEMRDVQSRGPFFLVGVCSGGTIAFEMAQQLLAQGQELGLLALVEPVTPYIPGPRAYLDFAVYVLQRIGLHLGRYSRNILRSTSFEQGTYIRLITKVIANQWALRRYLPRLYPGHLHLFLTGESLRLSPNPRLGWRELAVGGAEVHEIPGTRDAITGINGTPIEETCMRVVAEKLRACAGNTLLDG